MTNYSDKSGSVKVEFFKFTGKWYMTEAWDMSDYYYYQPTPIDAATAMLNSTDRGSKLLDHFIIVIEDPYHVNAYPVMLMPNKLRQHIAQLQLPV